MLKKVQFLGGIVTVIFLLILSILTISLSNSCESPFLCTTDVIFFIINLPGTIFFLVVSKLGWFSIDFSNPPTDSVKLFVKFFMIVVSVPFHFILGMLLDRLRK